MAGRHAHLRGLATAIHEISGLAVRWKMGPHLFPRHPHPEPAQLIGEWKFKGDDASVNNFLDQYVPILYIIAHRETPVSLGAPCPYRPPCAGPIGDPFLGAQ